MEYGTITQEQGKKKKEELQDVNLRVDNIPAAVGDAPRWKRLLLLLGSFLKST